MRLLSLLLIAGSPLMAQDATELALAKSVLSELQGISISENREYCGVIGFDADGKLVVSKVSAGTLDSCLAEDDGAVEIPVASFHTHGAFSTDHFNEVPSVEDVEGDEEEGIDGYVATPGGRLWYIDTQDMVMSQICGLGCLPADPDFVRGSDGVIEQSYTYDDLVELLED